MTLRIKAVGDISFNGYYHDLVPDKLHPSVFSQVHDALEGDLVIGNLESPLTSKPEVAPTWRYRLKGHPSFASSLREAGFSAVSLGNNHAMDFGAPGLCDTMGLLKEVGIPFFGAGANLDEARRPLHLEIKGKRISLLSYCSVPVNAPLYASSTEPGVCHADPKFISEDITKIRENSDLVIVCLHWGDEHLFLPDPEQRKFADLVLSLGADMILGHHSHVLQPVQMIGKKFVAYSLGNFVFSSETWNGISKHGEPFSLDIALQERHRRSGIMEILVSDEGIESFSLLPTYISGNEPIHVDTGKGRAEQWNRSLRNLNSPFYLVNVLRQKGQARISATYQRYLPNGLGNRMARVVRRSQKAIKARLGSTHN